MNHSLFTLVQYAGEELKDTYGPEEIRSICQIVFTDVFHYTNIDIHLKKSEHLNESFAKKFSEIVRRLQSGEPIQYIVGTTEFCGFRFGVTPATLIPRPETAELVHWVKENTRPGSSILDIGTGSGCIAVSLALLVPEARVDAADISEEALRQARTNARHNRTDIRFYQRDILHHDRYDWRTYDVIVSNPPYIRLQEKASMQPQVVEHEPHSALFVPDDQPLLFYKQIAAFGQTHLHPGGTLYFEINEAFGNEMIQLMEEFRYRNILLKKDFYGKHRFIKGEKDEAGA